MKFILTFCLKFAFCLAFVKGFRRCVITNVDCTLNSKICARGPWGLQCRTFRNPCLMETENCYRFRPFTQTVLTACNGLTDDVLGNCAS
ncbi:uncharacterized protein LOC110118105 [Ceratitis capitata]|uniref:uncharacterized protein LOC110118105 n=1 Tax=Ceratitis capitata TaxID=7213 RepID=UPI000A111A53|nr:uncharacterized protein LOC110118105 [Ceratitis capitata]